MKDQGKQLVAWARAEGQRIRNLNVDTLGSRSNAVRPIASAALEFLRRHAPGTQFQTSADVLFQYEQHIEAHRALLRIADILDAWADFAEAGMADILPFEVGARLEAATDLMEQVQRLLDDGEVNTAAPVVLAGAALEEFLRARVAATGATVVGNPSIATYAIALQKAGDLSKQEVKDITAWGGQRNEAAHGEFEKLSRRRAQIMVDGINFFIMQRST